MKMLTQAEAEALIETLDHERTIKYAEATHNYWVEEGLYETDPPVTLDGGCVMWARMEDVSYHVWSFVKFDNAHEKESMRELYWEAMKYAKEELGAERRVGFAANHMLDWGAKLYHVYWYRSYGLSYFADAPIHTSEAEAKEWFEKLSKNPELALPPEDKIEEYVNADHVRRDLYTMKEKRALHKRHHVAEPRWFRHLIAKD